MSYVKITCAIISVVVLALVLFGKLQQAAIIAFISLLAIGSYEFVKKICDNSAQDSAATPPAKRSAPSVASNKKPTTAHHKSNEKPPTKSVKASSVATPKPAKITWKNPPRR